MKFVKKIFIIAIILFFYKIAHSQVDSIYKSAASQLIGMLENQQTSNFKKAVFITENAFFDNELSEEAFNHYIKSYATLAEDWLKNNRLTNYPYKDSIDFAKRGAVFMIMTDTVFLSSDIILSLPFSYDYDDFFGEEDWTKMFVTKLLVTKKGNCHSMPLLYKILCEELGLNTYLAFAPNHLYIKQRSKKSGWYNTELTNGSFPNDGWLMASGYISRESILSGIYMDTLSQKQSITLCLLDLAQGYYHKQKEPDYNFLIEITDKALFHYPNFINALIFKANILNRLYQMENNIETKKQLEHTYQELVRLGYRKIPRQVYMEWIAELNHNFHKYQNPEINPKYTNK